MPLRIRSRMIAGELLDGPRVQTILALRRIGALGATTGGDVISLGIPFYAKSFPPNEYALWITIFCQRDKRIEGKNQKTNGDPPEPEERKGNQVSNPSRSFVIFMPRL